MILSLSFTKPELCKSKINELGGVNMLIYTKSHNQVEYSDTKLAVELGLSIQFNSTGIDTSLMESLRLVSFATQIDQGMLNRSPVK